MTAALPSAVRERLIKLCGLLTSEHDGERATAARMASDVLRQNRLTWRELLMAEGPCRVCAAREARESEQRRGWAESEWARADWRQLARHCIAHPDVLTEWEVGFLHSILRRRHLSGRQQAVLDRIADKIWEAGR